MHSGRDGAIVALLRLLRAAIHGTSRKTGRDSPAFATASVPPMDDAITCILYTPNEMRPKTSAIIVERTRDTSSPWLKASFPKADWPKIETMRRETAA